MPTNFPALVGKLISRFGITVGPKDFEGIGPLTGFTDLDRLALVPESQSSILTVAGTGGQNFATVPADERWKVQMLSWLADAGGVFSYQVGLQRSEAVGAPLFRMAFFHDGLLSADGLWYTRHYDDLWLFPGDNIRLAVDAFTTGEDVELRIMRLVEDCGGGGS